MSMTIPKPRVQMPISHYLWLGITRFKCIEPHCDGKHHVWCSCGH